MTKKYTAPTFQGKDFHCPHCEVYAHQQWSSIYYNIGHGVSGIQEHHIAECWSCHKFSIWVKEQLVYPMASPAPLPTEDMPEDIKEIYLEARDIASRSPRAAAGLLRFALHKLLPYLGVDGKDINEGIRELVKNGLPLDSQQALDIIRIFGNTALHADQINTIENTDTVTALFQFINWIIEDRITKKSQIREIYNLIPKTKREEIDRKDGRVPATPANTNSNPT